MPRLSAEELATRRLGMGSTDIVEVNGLAPWQGAGPMRVWCEKTGIASPDDAEGADEQRAETLDWGHCLEPVIADWYERTHGAKLLPAGPVHSLEHPWLWSTLDRIAVGANRLVEIKNCGSPALYHHWDTSSPDGVPDYVRGQVTVAMYCHGARETDVVASIGGRPPHVWTVFYDAELAALLVTGAVGFWGRVQSATPPPLDHTPASKAYLRDKYPANREKVIEEADLETCELAALRIEAAQRIAIASKEKDRLDAEILARVGERDGLRGPDGWKMTWKLDKNGVRRQRFTAGRGDE